MTKTSHIAAIFLANASSSPFSPLLKRTFSHKTASPAAHSTPPSHCSRNGTALPMSSDSLTATGASESSGVALPSRGRPRWESTITLAP